MLAAVGLERPTDYETVGPFFEGFALAPCSRYTALTLSDGAQSSQNSLVAAVGLEPTTYGL